MSERPREAPTTAGLAALTTLAGVWVLAYRCDNKELEGDGPVPLLPVLVAGILVFVVPLAVLVWRVVRRQRGMSVPVGVVSMASALFLAMRRPGNLVALWFPLVLVFDAAALLLITTVAGWRRERPRAAP